MVLPVRRTRSQWRHRVETGISVAPGATTEQLKATADQLAKRYGVHVETVVGWRDEALPPELKAAAGLPADRGVTAATGESPSLPAGRVGTLKSPAFNGMAQSVAGLADLAGQADRGDESARAQLDATIGAGGRVVRDARNTSGYAVLDGTDVVAQVSFDETRSMVSVSAVSHDVADQVSTAIGLDKADFRRTAQKSAIEFGYPFGELRQDAGAGSSASSSTWGTARRSRSSSPRSR